MNEKKCPKCPNCGQALNTDELASGRCFSCDETFELSQFEENNSNSKHNDIHNKKKPAKPVVIAVSSAALAFIFTFSACNLRYSKLYDEYLSLKSEKIELLSNYNELNSKYENLESQLINQSADTLSTETTEDISKATETSIEITTTPLGASSASDGNSVDSCEINKYMWKSSPYSYAALEIKNISDETININATFLMKDDSGNIISVKKDDADSIMPQQSAILYASDDNSFANFDYQIETMKSSYDSVDDKIAITDTTSDNKVIVTAQNISTETLSFPKVTALFFLNGQPVAINYRFVTDDSNKLQPQNTQYAEIKAYTQFDDYKLFVTGWTD
jgi:hypothetical protein